MPISRTGRSGWRCFLIDADRKKIRCSVRGHAFYHGLKGRLGDLRGFQARVEALDDRHLDAMVNGIPPEWISSSATRSEAIRRYLGQRRDHVGVLLDSLKGVMA